MLPLMMTPAQIQEARALLGWSQHDLARESGLAFEAVVSAETATTSGAPQHVLYEIKAAVERWGMSVPTDPSANVIKRVGRRPSRG